MPRGYRIVRSHPCKCGRPDCLAWGARKYSEECWENMPAHVKARMINKAMDASDLTVDVRDLLAPLGASEPCQEPVRRIKPYDWGDISEHSV